MATTSINGGTIFTAVIPVYLKATTAGTYTLSNTSVDDVINYSVDGSEFTQLGPELQLQFAAKEVKRVVFWYQNVAGYGAYCYIKFSTLSVSCLADPLQMIGLLAKDLPIFSNNISTKSGVSGLIYYSRQDGTGTPVPALVPVAASKDIILPRPSGTFSSNLLNFWTNTRSEFTRPSGSIEWPPIAVEVGSYLQQISSWVPISDQAYTSGATLIISPPKSSSGLPVTVSVKSGPASIIGNTVTLNGSGTVVLAANQGGDTTYSPAAEVTTSFNVKAGQSISDWNDIPTRTYSPGLSFTIVPPTASSGLPVDRKSVVSGKSVAIGGRRIIQKTRRQIRESRLLTDECTRT